VLFVSLRDLQWRRRRFLIGVVAAGLVFALAVILTGISASFVNEVSRTINAFHADQWVVSDKATGPFTSSTLLPDNVLAQLQHAPDVQSASPVLITRFTVKDSKERDTGIIGIVPGSPAAPKVASGRSLRGSGEMVADNSFAVGVGKVVDVGGTKFTVVGKTDGISYYAGTPALFVTLPDAQKLALAGQPLTTAYAVQGHLASAPPGTRIVTNAAAISDLKRPLESASGTIDILNVLMWIVAAGIIGSILYVQAIERSRDFAVFKATGVNGRTIAVGLAFQAIILALCAALVAVLLSVVIGPVMPMAVETPNSAYVQLLVVAVIIGIIASLFGLRRAVSVDPALAFG
jgi:putative ABC transport system permease protein